MTQNYRARELKSMWQKRLELWLKAIRFFWTDYTSFIKIFLKIRVCITVSKWKLKNCSFYLYHSGKNK